MALVIGGVHGDESVGPVALRTLFRSVDPNDVIGTIIIVPSMNVPAELMLQRFGPDRRNMNREFPGDPGGSVTQRICSAVAHTLAPRADLIVDVHSGGRSLTFAPGAALRLSQDEAFNTASWRLARALALPFIYCSRFGPHRPAHSSALAEDLGIPAVAMEVGGSETVSDAEVALTVRSLRNLLVSEQVMAGRPSTASSIALSLRDDLTVRAPAPGYFVFESALGHKARPSTALGRFIDMRAMDKPPIMLSSPVVGRIVAARSIAVCDEGDTLIKLGTELDGDPPGAERR